jgi:hypothetical protein
MALLNGNCGMFIVNVNIVYSTITQSEAWESYLKFVSACLLLSKSTSLCLAALAYNPVFAFILSALLSALCHFFYFF